MCSVFSMAHTPYSLVLCRYIIDAYALLGIIIQRYFGCGEKGIS